MVGNLNLERFDGLAELDDEPGSITARVPHVLVPGGRENVGGRLGLGISGRDFGTTVQTGKILLQASRER